MMQRPCSGAAHPPVGAGVQHSRDQYLQGRPLAANRTAPMKGYGFAGMARSYEVCCRSPSARMPPARSV